MKLFFTILIAAVLFFPAPAVEDTAAAAAGPELKSERGSLGQRVEQVARNQPAKDSNLFRPPTAAQQAAWRVVIENILSRRLEEAAGNLRELAVPYRIILFTDRTTKRRYVLLEEEDAPPRLGWGFYVFDLETRNRLAIEITHPVADARTEMEGIDAFLETRARAFLMAGTHRRANKKATPCSQPGPADEKSAAEAATYPESDVAHSTATIFQTTHETIVTADPGTIVVQLHGMAEREVCPNVFMSSGTKTITSNSTRLQACLVKQNVEAGIYEGDVKGCPLAATTNVQGRFSNGEQRDPCRTSVKAAPEPGLFIHIEQEPSIRRDKESWKPVVEALKCAFAQ